MARAKIYHNPRCGKSRQALALLLEEVGEEGVQVVEYLKDPPNERTLRGLLKKLRLSAADVVRRKEPPFKDLKLKDHLDDDAYLVRAICKHPILLERPIVEVGARAELGRPPENVLRLFR